MEVAGWALVVVLALVAVGGAGGGWLLRGRLERGSAAAATPAPEPATADDAPAEPPSAPRAAVVVNPIKVSTDMVRGPLEQATTAFGWDPPLWFETTADDPGVGQTEEALRAGVDVVCAYGGDGTVRAVAGALEGSGTPLALLPGGTGNLLARNLDLPVSDVADALRVALIGRDRTIDIGRLVITKAEAVEVPDDVGTDPRQDPPAEYVFCVMAGIGFDAEVMAEVDEGLKGKVGWLAYVVSGARLLRGRQVRTTLELDGRAALTRRVRAVVIGNCGLLTGGVALMPDAVVDDGWLDVVVVAPRGVAGWAGVVAQVLTRRRRGHPRVEHLRCRSIVVRTDEPQYVQVDGDPVGKAREVRLEVHPGKLAVRVPR